MTNFECIKSMNIEQLAQFLDDTQRRMCESVNIVNSDGTLRYQSLVKGWTNWLMKEAEFHDRDGPDASKTCTTCEYCKPDDLGDSVCTNAESDDCANWVDGDNICDCWDAKTYDG